LSSVLLLSVVGYALQNIATEVAVIVGRIIFGIGIYYASIYLELLIFHGANKDAYATDVSRVYFFQSLGVVFSSYCAGVLVDHANAQITFYVGALFLLLTALAFWLMKSHLIPLVALPKHSAQQSIVTRQALGELKGARHDF
jgi:DHA1 family multidrug resistance protein-like MFS transporter